MGLLQAAAAAAAAGSGSSHEGCTEAQTALYPTAAQDHQGNAHTSLGLQMSYPNPLSGLIAA